MTDPFCPDDVRRDRFRAAAGTAAGSALPHAIDVVEVLPGRRALLVRGFRDWPAALDRTNVVITGGVRVTPVRVLVAARADLLPAGTLVADDQAVVDAVAPADRPTCLVVVTDSSGDASEYTLRLVETGSAGGFDPVLGAASFSFKVDCPSDFDCRTDPDCPPDERETPRIDYLARDFASLRRVMLDRLAQTVPDWRDRGPLDPGVTIVEAIAYAGDLLSYRQDAVATEAYLGTARLRSSVRRHARLLDYPFHDGVNARAWIVLEADASADGEVVDAGTRVVPERGPTTDDPRALDEAVAAGVAVFETLEDVIVRAARNAVPVHTWGDPACCLPRGATTATLRADQAVVRLARGDVLVLEEVRGLDGLAASADPAHRHAVRLVEDPVPAVDALGVDDGVQDVAVVEVRWGAEDALPFALAVGGSEAGPRAVAHANVVLADHGLRVADAPRVVPDGGRFRPALDRSPVTMAVPHDAAAARRRSAHAATATDPGEALPAIWPVGEGATWRARRDLLASDAFASDFVYEAEDDGSGRIRFGDDVHGRRPTEGERYAIAYRIGTGPEGNVGHGTLVRALGVAAGIRVTNPLPATGGRAPEATDHARLHAPEAFRRQERAVTEADYAAMAERHPEVQRAAATRRWTGSWTTVYLTVDRRGGMEVDPAFEARLRGHLDRYRMAGVDVEIDGPRWVPLDLALAVCVRPGHVRTDVERALLDELSAGTLRDGRQGAFHPDRLTFGQPVHLAPVLARVMAVAGVLSVAPVRFQRWREPAAGELEARRLAVGRLEIARLDNDPSRPELGHLELRMEGGS